MLSFLHLLSGTRRIESEDPIWSFVQRIPSDLSIQHTELDQICDQLIKNNTTTSNLLTFIDHVSRILKNIIYLRSHGKMNETKDGLEYSIGSFGLYLLNLLLGNIISKLDSIQFKLQLGLSSTWPTTHISGRHDDIIELLLIHVMEIIASFRDHSSNLSETYDLKYFSILFLLCIQSSTLYRGYHQSIESNRDIFGEFIQSISFDSLHKFPSQPNGRISSDLFVHFMTSMLEICSDTNLPSSSQSLLYRINQFPEKYSFSVFNTVSYLRNLLRIYFHGESNQSSESNPFSSSNPFKESTVIQSDLKYLLSYHGINLLNIILNIPPSFSSSSSKQQFQSINIFREIFASLKGYNMPSVNYLDYSSLNEMNPFCDFDRLTNTLSSILPSENAIVFLYFLLHVNSYYSQYLADSKHLDVILLPLLQMIVLSSNHSPIESLYMSTICIMMIVQDSILQSKLADTFVSISWYRGRYFKDISLSNLTLLCSLRCIMDSIRRNDSYLFKNITAIIINTTSHIKNIHPHVSERIIGIITFVANQIKNYSFDDKVNIFHRLSMCLDALMIITRMILIYIRSDVHISNIELAYAILRDIHKLESSREKLSSILTDMNNEKTLLSLSSLNSTDLSEVKISLTSVISNIDRIIFIGRKYLEKVDNKFATQLSMSANEVVAFLEKSIDYKFLEECLPKSIIDIPVICTYEEDRSLIYIFLNSFTWSLVIKSQGMKFWNENRIRLFQSSNQSKDKTDSYELHPLSKGEDLV